VPSRFLPTSRRALPALQATVSRRSAKGIQCRRVGILFVIGTAADPVAFRSYLDPARRVNWVVYAKPPFAGAEQVLEYVGRYTHRVAIANNRIVDIEDDKVRFFRWKDYRNENRQKVMTLDAGEFIRRFLVHVLPEGFQRIRYYGFMGNRYRKQKLARCRELLGMQQSDTPVKPKKGRDYRDKVGADRSFPAGMSLLPSRADGVH
jgi:hypothetical protein